MDAKILLEKIKDSRFVDSNGEVTDALPIVEEYSRQQVIVAMMSEQERRKEIHEFLKVRDNYSRENFISCIDDELMRIIPLMKLEEAGLVMRLLAFLSTDDGILKDKHGFLHVDRIIEIAGISESTVKRYLKNLIKLEVLEKAGVNKRKTIYAFNKNIHARGRHTTGYFTKIWLSNLRDKWYSLPLDTLGFMYRIIPYFNTYSCCLSMDAYEYDVVKAQPISVRALEKMLGMKNGSTKKHIDILTAKGLMVRIKVGRSIVLCVSPNIMYRKAVLEGEEVATDETLIFKQASMLMDNEDDILAYRRAVVKVKKDSLVEAIMGEIPVSNMTDAEKSAVENTVKVVVESHV